MAPRDYTTTRDRLGETFVYMTEIEERTLGRVVFPQRVEHVIDVASGTGRLLPFLLRHADRITAIDREATFFDRARAAVPREDHARVDWVVGDIVDTDLPERADVILVSGLLIFFDDEGIRTLFERLAAHLKPGGVIWNREPVANAYEWRRLQNDRFPEALYRSRKHLHDAITASGLRVRDWGYLDTRRIAARSMRKLADATALPLPHRLTEAAARLEGQLVPMTGDPLQFERRLIEANNAYAFAWGAFEHAPSRD